MTANTPIWKIMTADLKTVSLDTSIQTIKAIFTRNNFHHLPVEDNLGEILGIISVSDVSRADSFSSDSKSSIEARHIMTASVETITLDTTIREAVELFLAKNFRALPVLDKNGVFLGLVTTHDLLRCMPELCVEWQTTAS